MQKRILFLLAGFFCLLCFNARAEISIISDEETELYLQSVIRPIFQAAGVPYNRNKIFVIEDNSLNAFVSDGNYLFIHSEVLLKVQSSDELRGVIAHEAGHIQGGHILRQKLQMQEMRYVSLASLVVAGALGAASGRGDVAAAVALGSHSSLINQSLTYRVQEERSADEAAVSLLKKLHYSPKGLLAFMKKIQIQNKLQGVNENSYFNTHPLSGERIAFLEQASKQSPYISSSKEDAALKRVQAKLFAFIKSPAQTVLKYPSSDQSVEARYARAISGFKKMNFAQAHALTDSLINDEPKNPHFRELKGQILIEQGKVAEAKKEFSQACQLMPESVYFKINEAQALLELTPSPQELKSVIRHLQQSLITRPMAIGWLLLSKAYDLNRQNAEAQYAAARYSFTIGDYSLAQKQAENAKKASLDPKLTLKIDDLLQLLKTRDSY